MRETQKSGIRIPTETELQAALTAANAAPVAAWDEGGAAKPLIAHAPTAGGVMSRRTLDDLGVTVVRFANGVEAWLKPTDFKNDQVVFSLQGLGGTSLAPPADLAEAEIASAYIGVAGIGGLKPTDLQKTLTGKIASASPYIGLSVQGVNGSAVPAQLETALQLLYQTITAPGDDADAFALRTHARPDRSASRSASTCAARSWRRATKHLRRGCCRPCGRTTSPRP